MKRVFSFLFIILLIVSIFACRNENFVTEPSAKLKFSSDTVLFDTVFTTIGSTTKQLRIKNTNRLPIKISDIHLANGDKSNFRLNINGLATNRAENVEIAGNDSMYIFVEVTVNPTGKNNPMVMQDSIVFQTNGNLQDVDLVAWGQDMHVFRNAVLETQTWVNDKPYLIYDSLFIDENQTLTIEAGTRVHFHKNARMFVFGNLHINGTVHDSVVFQGSRLEHMYVDVPGQWIGIVFIEGSRDNKINYTVFKNGIIGLNVGTLSTKYDNKPVIELYNTKIEHMTYAGIYALSANIKAYNCLIDNCGTYNMALVIGGSYEFYHCTFASYWPYSVRSEPSIVITNNLVVDRTNNSGQTVKVTYSHTLEKADFGNTIICGLLNSELGLGDDGQSPFNYYFDQCLMRVDTSVHTKDTKHFNKPLVNPYDFRFKNYTKHDYRLDTLSPAKDYCDYSLVNRFLQYLEHDLKGDLRDTKPDIGAYERIEKH